LRPPSSEGYFHGGPSKSSLPGAALLAGFLYTAVHSDQTQSTINQKVSDAFEGKTGVVQGGFGALGTDNGPDDNPAPRPEEKPDQGSNKPSSPPPPLPPKKDQGFWGRAKDYVTSGQVLKDTGHIAKKVSGCFVAKDIEGHQMGLGERGLNCPLFPQEKWSRV
jgi:hypothetical protein